MILFDSVSKFYPGDQHPALFDVSLHIAPNEFVFLVGKSGAGKSTLMKLITKEERQSSGKIIIGGIDLDYVKKRNIPHYRRRLGVVFQDFKLLPRRTVFENVSFALEIAGMSGREIRRTVPKVLDLVGLLEQANKYPDQLSGGQQQRVSIARSVARQPKILIADEPTGNLDKLTRREIVDLLKRINDFGTTVLVTTHDENIVNLLQKRVITIKDGRVVSDQKENGVYRLGTEPKIQPVGINFSSKTGKKTGEKADLDKEPIKSYNPARPNPFAIRDRARVTKVPKHDVKNTTDGMIPRRAPRPLKVAEETPVKPAAAFFNRRHAPAKKKEMKNGK
ncbi:cell division ATP-binding protein FtsE [Candidatus Saccharibacteria bacterium]|nr:cell division ATP-binding protein FtsE [Candidatus Saccharibacteria bacterium]